MGRQLARNSTLSLGFLLQKLSFLWDLTTLIFHISLCPITLTYSAVQNQKAVSAYFTSKQILHFALQSDMPITVIKLKWVMSLEIS